jgi:MFS family permease
MRLWIGQSVSVFGNQLTGFALPWIAVKSLGADAGQVGLFLALGTFPFLLFGLFVGVFVDRHRRRPILIVGDLGRGAIVGGIALLAFGGLLRLEYLYILAFLTGTFTVFFDVAYQAYLPSLVAREQLVEGNSKLETTNSASQLAGPSVAGLIVQYLSAAWAMTFDALTFVFSAAMMVFIRKEEVVPESAERKSRLSEAREGLRVVFRDIRLWSIAGCTGTSNFFSGALFAVLFPFAINDLRIDAGPFGIATGFGAVGALAGAFLAAPLAKRIGVGHAIVIAIFVGSLGALSLIVATPTTIFFAIVVTTAFAGFGALVYNINQVSLRQALVPIRLQGRLNATMRFLVWGTLPIGSLTGGFLGTVLGNREGIAIAAVGGLFAGVWVLLSPVRSIRMMPEPDASSR